MGDAFQQSKICIQTRAYGYGFNDVISPSEVFERKGVWNPNTGNVESYLNFLVQFS